MAAIYVLDRHRNNGVLDLSAAMREMNFFIDRADKLPVDEYDRCSVCEINSIGLGSDVETCSDCDHTLCRSCQYKRVSTDGWSNCLCCLRMVGFEALPVLANENLQLRNDNTQLREANEKLVKLLASTKEHVGEGPNKKGKRN